MTGGPGKPESLFPLVRQISFRLTPALAATPISPNQITTVSLLGGLAAAASLLAGQYSWTVAAALLLTLNYVLDNCDGEVARLKNQSSAFGHHYDNFVDWVVHAAFFAALGMGESSAGGSKIWLWLGLLGAAGATINYVLAIFFSRREKRELGATFDPTDHHIAKLEAKPRGWKEHAIYVLRELTRADFCFIVLALALFDVAWILLPTAAVGAHAYWIAQLFGDVRKFQA